MNAMQNKKVLITGADGFIGSHLTEMLVETGARVRAVVKYNSWGAKGWLSDVPAAVLSQTELFLADIRDADRVRQAVEGCDIVFHLASLASVPYSYDAPRSYIDTNITGIVNVLQACRACGVECIVTMSTSEVYGTAQTVPIAETHPLVAQSPYAASKIAADKMAESFHRCFGVPVVMARPFNTYGPRQTARAVIPAIASQLLNRCAPLKLGAVHPTRDFNYVRDTAAGVIALASCKEAEGKVVNIGTGEEWSIGRTAELLMEITGHAPPIVLEDQRLRPVGSEVNRLVADARLMHSLTGWVPRTGFAGGLKATSEWIAGHLASFDQSRYAF